MDFPVDHLSASSLTTFLRCPRQWQERYVYKQDGPSNSSLVIGSAVHLALSRKLLGEPEGDYFGEILAGEREIIWKDSEDVSFNTAKKHIWDYYELIGKHLDVLETEREISIEIPGVPIPVVGFVDIVCPDRVIDLKTTGYFNRKVALNPEWKLQAHIYQLAFPQDAEFHVLTRSKTDPVVTPTYPGHELYISPPQRRETEQFVRQVYDEMEFMWNRFGEDEWRGNVTHPWAGRYCPVANCCQR